MDIALVTGAERGAGLKIAQKLIDLGLRVYGLAQDFSKCHFQHPDFSPLTCDLTRRDHLESAWEQIQARHPVVSCFVHAAQYVPSNPLEATRPEELEYILHTTLLCPMVLSRLAAPSLIKTHGQLIFVGHSGPGGPPRPAALVAAEAGLFALGQALFEELRDTGVKVCTLTPQRNAGEADPKGRLRMQPQSEIDNGLLADAVETVLSFKGHNAISQIVIRPQGRREDPIIATAVPELTRAKHAVLLPAAGKGPVEEQLIPTPKRARPDDAPPPGSEPDEDEVEEDDVLDQLLEESRSLLKRQRDLAKDKLEETQEARERALRPRFIPIEVVATPTPSLAETEAAKREAAEARVRLANLLGIPIDEVPAPSSPTAAQPRTTEKAHREENGERFEDETEGFDPDSDREYRDDDAEEDGDTDEATGDREPYDQDELDDSDGDDDREDDPEGPDRDEGHRAERLPYEAELDDSELRPLYHDDEDGYPDGDDQDSQLSRFDDPRSGTTAEEVDRDREPRRDNSPSPMPGSSARGPSAPNRGTQRPAAEPRHPQAEPRRAGESPPKGAAGQPTPTSRPRGGRNRGGRDSKKGPNPGTWSGR